MCTIFCRRSCAIYTAEPVPSLYARNAPTREACLRCAEGDGKPVTPRPEKLLLPPFLPRRRPKKGLFPPFCPRTAPAAPPDPGFSRPNVPPFPAKSRRPGSFSRLPPGFFAPASAAKTALVCAETQLFAPFSRRAPRLLPRFCPGRARFAPGKPPRRPSAPRDCPLGRRLPPDPRPAAAPAEVHFAASPWRSVWGPRGASNPGCIPRRPPPPLA